MRTCLKSRPIRKEEKEMSYLVLTESPQRINSQAQSQKSKLESMKNQLEQLFSKKIRIDQEIRILRKSLKKKAESYQKITKTMINREAFDENWNPTENSTYLIENFLDPQIFREIDKILREIEELFEEISEELDN